MKKMLVLATWAIAVGLTLLALSAPVHANPVTYAELYFRMPTYLGSPFTEVPVYLSEYGTNLANLNYTSARGSVGRFEADAGQGTLRGFADAVNGAIGVAAGDQVWASGYVRDDFTLTGPPPGTPVTIQIYFGLDGTLLGAGSNPGTIEAFENAYIATQFVVGPVNDLFAQWARTELEMGYCWENGCGGFSIPINRVVSFDLNVLAGVPFEVYYYMTARGGWAYGGSGGTADFGATGAISFTLPAGTSIASSGGFFQGDGGQIPEPATVLLAGAGLAGLGIWKMKKRARPN
ncbi:MAG: PEP-CTERM sorting domain-containing protein [Candidatus Solibacter usitatus]|nr:PEP-CTERM sorting domain-containing protein [Candidatus Solibacter usitatus]